MIKFPGINGNMPRGGSKHVKKGKHIEWSWWSQG
jgi:hypothetical protein